MLLEQVLQANLMPHLQEVQQTEQMLQLILTLLEQGQQMNLMLLPEHMHQLILMLLP